MNTAVAHSRLTPDAARTLTEEVKADAATLWSKLLTLYEGEAHTSLGYSSWGAYYEAEFGSKSEGYRLLDAARVVDAIPNVGNELPAIPTVHHAQALVPVLRDEPEAVEEVWGDVVELHGDSPTAAEVREVVEARVVPGPRKAQQTARIVGGIVEKAQRINELAPHLDLDVVNALDKEEKEAWAQQLRNARTVLSRLIAAVEQ